MIPAEAVKAAAKGAYSVGKIDAGVDWDHLYPTLREVYIDMARAALEAAAPHIRAQALEDAKDALTPGGSYVLQNIAEWLSERARLEKDTK